MARFNPLSAATLGLLALAACDGSPTVDTASALSADETTELASLWDEIGASAIDGSGGPLFSLAAGADAVAMTTTTSFSRQQPCPAGGTSTLAGQRVVTADPETRTGNVSLTATRTDAACAFNARRGSGATLTLTGTPNVQVAAQQAWAAGVPGVHTATTRGSFSWARSTGQSGTCSVDLTSTRTPATRTYTVAGTFCGQTINVTRTRS
ncbi:MAG TPA: hypothetical protein VF665_14835 [Longimicrobium sp.]|uniref:hypothetical protein n=1 Tax=Longimicrobium sp. TaxID=2029185 RepID=UPI002ED998D7